MPVYEYVCQDCRKHSSILVLSLRNPAPAGCPHCGSSKVERLMSRFASPKSEEARLESLADPGNLGAVDESDPQSVARFMKQMGDEMGQDGGGDVDSLMDQMPDDEITDANDGL